MEFLLIIIFVPLVVWGLDRLFYRGELAEALVETLHTTKESVEKARKNARTTSPDKVS